MVPSPGSGGHTRIHSSACFSHFSIAISQLHTRLFFSLCVYVCSTCEYMEVGGSLYMWVWVHPYHGACVEIRGQLLGVGLCIFTLLMTGSLQCCARQVSWLASEIPLSPFPAPCWVKLGIIHTLAPCVSWRSEFRFWSFHNKWLLPTEPSPQTLDYCHFVLVLPPPLSCPLTYGLLDNGTRLTYFRG